MAQTPETQTPETRTPEAVTVEWLSVLPGRGEEADLSAPRLVALVADPQVVQAGATVETSAGQDASGQRRVRLRVSHGEAETVALTRDALMRVGRRLGLRVFLV